ncbi:PucR family transcriptional regulator [Flexivirga caeni]|nr:helix-turn-helix domain-containing protein [Flexivirga caeni]
MIEAASTAAIAMLRRRVAADSSRHMRTVVVTSLIDGGPTAVSMAGKMNRNISGGCILAVGVRNDPAADGATASAKLDRLANSLWMWLNPEIPDAVTAVVDNTAYAVIPAHGDRPPEMKQLRRLSEEFARRAGKCDEVVVAIGKHVAGVAEMRESRKEADLALRVLCTTPDLSQRVAIAADLQAHVLVMQLSDLMACENMALAGPIAVLRAYDEQHQAALEMTLRAWLDHFGDVATAAAALHVHKNTFRYRLGRVVGITGIDLGDAETRFHLMLQFRLGRT